MIHIPAPPKTMERFSSIAARLSGRGIGVLLLVLFQISSIAHSATEPRTQGGKGQPGPGSLFDLPFEQALELTLASPATLTRAAPRRVPAAVTRIDEAMIRQSGARSLNEALDIFVPNAQLMRYHFRPGVFGMRGINSANENKYLLLVNGRLMNSRTTGGILSERDLPMLSDIERIEVVRGPGSVVHGPGAVAGVIDIKTYDGLSFQGWDLSLRQGFVEEFTGLELRYGRRFGEDSGIFLYYGIADYGGADQKDSPHFFSKTFTTTDGTRVDAGRPASFQVVDDHRAYRDQPKHKAHLQYDNGNLELWLRYTRGGEQAPNRLTFLSPPPFGVGAPGDSENLVWDAGYQQLSAFIGYTHEFGDEFSLEMAGGYKLSDRDRRFSSTTTPDLGLKSSDREEEVFARLLGRWESDSPHSAAAGFEFSRGHHGQDASGFGTEDTSTFGIPDASPWYSTTFSPLGEYRWALNDEWTLFLGARYDKHSFTDWLFSPRAALVHTPNEKDSFKLIANRSLRRPNDANLRASDVAGTSSEDEEKIEALELRYERQHSRHLRFALSGVYQEVDILSFNAATSRVEQIGGYDSYAIEAELSYRSDSLHLGLSHGYTQLIDFDLASDAIVQFISAEPYGFGDDLANWADHITKLYARCDLSPRWSADGSLRIYWGFPGAEDLTDYNNQRSPPAIVLPLSDPGEDDAFEPSAFLNFGFEHRPADDLTLRLDAYNVLGWIDKDANKRNFFIAGSEYRSEAAAVGLTLRYGF